MSKFSPFVDMVPKELVEKCDPRVDAFDLHILQKKEHDLVARGQLSVEAIHAEVGRVPQEMSDSEATARMICELHGIPIEVRKLGPELVISIGNDFWERCDYKGYFTLPWCRPINSCHKVFHTADWVVALQVVKTYKVDEYNK